MKLKVMKFKLKSIKLVNKFLWKFLNKNCLLNKLIVSGLKYEERLFNSIKYFDLLK